MRLWTCYAHSLVRSDRLKPGSCWLWLFGGVSLGKPKGRGEQGGRCVWLGCRCYCTGAHLCVCMCMCICTTLLGGQGS